VPGAEEGEARVNSYCLQDISWLEAERLRTETNGVILVPFGSIEGHGHHCPLGTDAWMAQAVTERAAAKARVPFTPMIPAAVSPQHLQGRPGTLTVREHVFIEYLRDVCRSLIANGWTKLVLVNGHEGNIPAVWNVMRRIKYETGALCVGVDIGVLMKTAVDGLIENPPEELPAWHASEIETSLMLAIDEGLVTWELAKAEYPRTPAIVAGSSKFVQDAGFSKTIKFGKYQVFLPQENADYSTTSTVGNPERATAQKGAAILDRFVDYTADLCDELRGLNVEVHTTAFPDRM
jgi:creatinine amidohydrolase